MGSISKKVISRPGTTLAQSPHKRIIGEVEYWPPTFSIAGLMGQVDLLSVWPWSIYNDSVFGEGLG